MERIIKDLTLNDIECICINARTNPKGKVKNRCVETCPLYLGNTQTTLFTFFAIPTTFRICDIVAALNGTVTVPDSKHHG